MISQQVNSCIAYVSKPTNIAFFIYYNAGKYAGHVIITGFFFLSLIYFYIGCTNGLAKRLNYVAVTHAFQLFYDYRPGNFRSNVAALVATHTIDHPGDQQGWVGNFARKESILVLSAAFTLVRYAIKVFSHFYEFA